MEYRRLGASGIKVSELCLGTMTFGRQTDQQEANRIVDAALGAGVNFIDTADGYTAGASEEILGKALGARRRDVVLASKVFNAMGKGPNDSGLSRAHIMLAVEDSLRRLNTDWIDLYYLHHVDVQTPHEETLRALDDLVRQGKVRYPAISNFEAWRLMETSWLCRTNGWAEAVCYQPQYSLVVRDIEEEIVPVCELKGLGVAVWSPLAGGFLAGRYRPGETRVKGSRSEEGWVFPFEYFHPAYDAILGALLDVAAELGRTPAQVALRWVLEKPWISSAIVGGRNAAQFADSLQAAEFALPAEALARLDAVSALPRRYPRSMEEGMVKRRADALGR